MKEVMMVLMMEILVEKTNNLCVLMMFGVALRKYSMALEFLQMLLSKFSIFVLLKA